MRAKSIVIHIFISWYLLAGLLVTHAAHAMGRPLPKDGVLGVFQTALLPQIVIDGRVLKLSAGAQVRNAQNLIVQPTSIRHAADVRILYKKNKQGQVDGIWMLTNQEYEQISASPHVAH